MTFQESDLQFQFSDSEWQIKKYDTHKYFKTLSGAGLKGVDFLGIYRKNQVVLWEIKNYHTNQVAKNQKYLIVENTPLFIEKMIAKVTDTLTVIRVIHQYLMRQWWYRFYRNYRSFIPTFLIRTKDWFFWHQIQEKWNSETPIIFVLWVEIATDFEAKSWSSLTTTIQQDLSKQLKAYNIEVVISNMHQPCFNTSVAVDSLQ